MSAVDPVALAQALIRRPSVTPRDEGALGVLEAALAPLGFRCERMPFSQPGTPDIDNLYARHGAAGPHFCFAGHSDVVPVGDLNVEFFQKIQEHLGVLVGTPKPKIEPVTAPAAPAASLPA